MSTINVDAKSKNRQIPLGNGSTTASNRSPAAEGAVWKIEILYIMDFLCFVCDKNKNM